MTDSPATVTEALSELARAGFDADFELQGDRIRCPNCGRDLRPDELSVSAVYRFEGPSDPGDEMIVLGLTCGPCGQKGALAAAYGPASTPEEAAALTALGRRAGQRG